MRCLHFLLLLVLIGCGEPTAGPNAKSPNRIEKMAGKIYYDSGMRVAKDGKAWVPVAQKPEGEEKLSFKQTNDIPIPDSVLDPIIVIDGPDEDRKIIEEMEYHLRKATTRKQLPISKYGMGPFGLTNELYFGHTFWDMDVWMLPTMALLDPSAVKEMAQYRVSLVPQALKNYREELSIRKLIGPETGYKFPWESSVTGKETVIGESKKEIHVSGSVLWGLSISNAIGVGPSDAQLNEITIGVANYFRSRATKTERGLELKDVMSPDELHVGDNDLYTNLLAQWAANGRKFVGTTKFYLPKDSKTFLTYDNDAQKAYKQAAAVLSIYPLQYPEAEAQAEKLMSRFENKVIKNGPAMADSIHATIWARLEQTEKAYRAWQEGWKPFTLGSEKYFSEKRSVPRTYFYTGAAGSLNAVLYGFCGIRLEQRPAKTDLGKGIFELQNGWSATLTPHLPKAWNSVKLNGVWVGKMRYTIKIDRDNRFEVSAF